MTTNSLKNQVLQLAVAFRNDPASPAHRHAEVYSLIAYVGGRAAILYGMWAVTTPLHRVKKREFGLEVSSALSEYACKL
jgi:hypothetical protein